MPTIRERSGSYQIEVFLGRDINSEQNYSDKIAYEIDTEIQDIIKTCYERARKILTEHRSKLDLIANTLLEVETLDAEQIRHLADHGTLPERKKSDDVKVNVLTKKEAPVSENLSKDDTISEGRDDKQTPPTPPDMETNDPNKL